MKPLDIIFGIIIIIAALTLVFNIQSHIDNNSEIVDGNCFDRDNNKIQGLTCDVDKNSEENELITLVGLVVSLMMVLLGMVLILTGVTRK